MRAPGQGRWKERRRAGVGVVAAVAVLLGGCAETPDVADSASDADDAVLDREAVLLADTAVADTAAADQLAEGPTWVLETVLGRAAGEGAAATLHLDRDTGRVTGDTGCNAFTGGYELTGTLLRLGAVGMTRLACPGGLAQQETDLLEAFRVAGSFEVHGDELRLLSEQGVVATWRVAR